MRRKKKRPIKRCRVSGKVIFDNVGSATSAKYKAGKKFNNISRAYFDDICEHWHLTTKLV